MVITFSSRRRRQRILLGVLALVLLLTFGIFYRGFFMKEKPSGFRMPGGQGLGSEVAAPSFERERIKIDFSFFETGLFKSLKTPPLIETKAVTFGRKNPFSPY